MQALGLHGLLFSQMISLSSGSSESQTPFRTKGMSKAAMPVFRSGLQGLNVGNGAPMDEASSPLTERQTHVLFPLVLCCVSE